jgi:Domain of unknown function (DUF4965)/Domain of unknown function (DUF1793)/Domain of unknown function (DUF5127)/Domain of unknown function (DUF4964)
MSQRKLTMTVVISTISLLFSVSARAQDERPPAVPLVVHNPYFSVWSMADKLTDDTTRHWTGAQQAMTGLISIDGKIYRYMGRANVHQNDSEKVPVLDQRTVNIYATHTCYEFEGAGIRMKVCFFTPAFPQDVDLLSRPVTYVNWEITSADGGLHKVQLLLAIDPAIAVNTDSQKVTWGRSEARGLHVLSIGSRDQDVLGKSGDDLRIDWGYFHLGVPSNEAAVTVDAASAIRDFIDKGALSPVDDMDMPRAANWGGAKLAVEFPIEVSSFNIARRHVLLSYTEDYAIEYMGTRLRPYWQRGNKSVQQMLTEAENDYAVLEDRGQKYDAELDKDLTAVGGPGYRQIAILAYRQTLAAHGLVAGQDGKPLMFEKENFSCGCIATVDVIYPAAPYFLFFNPDLLEAQLRPIFEYASLPQWNNPWAPHDLGRYPLANGHGPLAVDGPVVEEESMPVEESGDMLILAAALARAQGDLHLARQYWPLLSRWAAYLREKGLDPDNQLSTDDFAGKLAHNTNLSIKAIDALASYAQLARGLGYTTIAKEYEALARKMAAQWEQMAFAGDHYKLAFDRNDTWSQKYNLVWDDLMDLHIFSPKVRKIEIAYYLKHMNALGLPLDVRADYTKADWELWTATLADSASDFDALLAPVVKWVNTTPSRVPLTDWYDTKTGLKSGFQARSVVGGVYIKALSNQAMASKWKRWH